MKKENNNRPTKQIPESQTGDFRKNKASEVA